MNLLKNLWKSHRVFIMGLLFAVSTATIDLLYFSPIDYWVLMFAAISAIGSYLSENLPGRLATIAGSFSGNLLMVLTNMKDGQDQDPLQTSLFLIVSLALQISGANYSPKGLKSQQRRNLNSF